MRFGRVICTLAIATCVVFSALAQGLPKANKLEDVGFSSHRTGSSQRTVPRFLTFLGKYPAALTLRKSQVEN
jgi:hypothetical protein